MLSTLAVGLLNLTTFGVSVVGHIPSGLPPLTMPDASMFTSLVLSAMGIALMSFTESNAAARSFRKQKDSPLDANRELVALGAANTGGSFFGAMVGGGGTSQTALNIGAGAQSQATSLVVALSSALILLVLSGLIGKLPHAALAAIVVVYSIGLIRPAELRRILRVRRTEFVWALTAVAGVAVLGTLRGIIVAVVVSMIALIKQTSNPKVLVLRQLRATHEFVPEGTDPTDELVLRGVLIIRPEGRLYFANAERFVNNVRSIIETRAPQIVILHLRAVPDFEYTALVAFEELLAELSEKQIAYCFAGVNQEVLGMMNRAGITQSGVDVRVYPSIRAALENARRESLS